MSRHDRCHRRWFMVGVLLLSGSAWAQPVQVAVAANFRATLETIAADFTQKTGDEVKISSASSGVLYSQIQHGAPFDLFFSADEARPALLEQQQKIVTGSRFTYAIGQLALWSPKAKPSVKLLQTSNDRIAIANPKTAPYGVAAKQTLQKMGLWDKFAGKIVQGNNIAQTFQFIDSGNAPLGFVAYADLVSRHQEPAAWIVPNSYHQPIKQQAVLLKRGENNKAAQALYRYLKEDAGKVIVAAGYQLPSGAAK